MHVCVLVLIGSWPAVKVIGVIKMVTSAASTAITPFLGAHKLLPCMLLPLTETICQDPTGPHSTVLKLWQPASTLD